MIERRTLADELAAFRTANRLRHDEAGARLWLVRFGFWTLPLPNFAWRRRAIDTHDVHHLITGYPFTVTGEVRIAAWEFGAGRYPHWGAAWCCAPLVLLGLLSAPRDVCAAYRLGRRQRSLYRADLARLLEEPVERARMLVQAPASCSPGGGQRALAAE